MKCIILYDISAVEAWDLGICAHALPVEWVDPHSCACNAADLRAFEGVLPQLTRPLHILVPNKSARRQSDRWHCHTLSHQPPRHSFCKLAEGIYIAAPYLCFRHFARRLSFAHSLLLGMELCGGYSTLRLHREAKRTSPGKGYLEREPLSTPTQLQRYIAACDVGKNCAARRASSLLQEGAASPRESVTHALLHPALVQGGFAIRGYEINGEIPLDSTMAKAAGVESFFGDFYWRSNKLVLEYDGRDYHANDAQRTYDNLRRTILGELGIRVISVDKGQLKDLATIEHIAGAIASHLGHTLSEPAPRTMRVRRELHRQLLFPDIDLYGETK